MPRSLLRGSLLTSVTGENLLFEAVPEHVGGFAQGKEEELRDWKIE